MNPMKVKPMTSPRKSLPAAYGICGQEPNRCWPEAKPTQTTGLVSPEARPTEPLARGTVSVSFVPARFTEDGKSIND